MVNFLLTEMTFLRYYIPLIRELNSRGVKSLVSYTTSGKITSPGKGNNLLILEKLSRENSFHIAKNEQEPKDGPWVLVEASGLEQIKPSGLTYSLTYMSDFNILYERYIDKIDHVILPSVKFGEYYNKLGPKNLYLGSPKYDIELNREDILNKYNLSADLKYAFLFYPKRRDRRELDAEELIDSLRRQGLTPLIKTRKKDGVDKSFECRVFYDEPNWFPHPSLELISISDIVINTGSTGVKESIMLSKPIVNIDIKPKPSMGFLYDYAFARVQKGWDVKAFEKNITELLEGSFDIDFQKCKEDNLFHLGSSERIVDEILRCI